MSLALLAQLDLAFSGERLLSDTSIHWSKSELPNRKAPKLRARMYSVDSLHHRDRASMVDLDWQLPQVETTVFELVNGRSEPECQVCSRPQSLSNSVLGHSASRLEPMETARRETGARGFFTTSNLDAPFLCGRLVIAEPGPARPPRTMGSIEASCWSLRFSLVCRALKSPGYGDLGARRELGRSDATK